MTLDQKENLEEQRKWENERKREERVKTLLQEFPFLVRIRDKYYPKLQIFDIQINQAISEVSACDAPLEDRQDIDTGIGDGETYITKLYIVSDDDIYEQSKLTDIMIIEQSLPPIFLVIVEEGTRWSDWPEYIWRNIVMNVYPIKK